MKKDKIVFDIIEREHQRQAKGIELRVKPFDAREHRLRGVDRAGLATTVEGQQFVCGALGQVGGHGSSSRC